MAIVVVEKVIITALYDIRFLSYYKKLGRNKKVLPK